MTTNSADLSSLIERLEKADGPDDALDRDILKALGARLAWDWTWGAWFGDERFYATNLTASLDAALALCERALPDWDIDLGKVGGEWFATVLPQDGTDIDGEQAPSPALALCLALLRALSQKESKE